MPIYPHILSEIARTPWAIMPSSLRSIVGAAEGKLSAADYPNFHGAPQEEQQAVSAMLGTKSEGARMSSVRDGIGIMQINGPIVPRADLFTEMSGLTSVDRLSAEFSALAVDPSVRRILLVMDSPGGAITGISEFASQIETSEKPVTAYVYGMAASAGYWIASAADEIIGNDTAMVGSIGVVMGGRKSADDEWEMVSSQSPRKRPNPETEDGRDELQNTLDGLAEVFIETVARNRNVSAETVIEKFGRGGMVLPKEALRVGMIDGVSTLASYLEAIAAPTYVGTTKKNSISASSESNLIDNPNQVNGYLNTGLPENAGDQGAREMTLKEFLASSPEATKELGELVAKERTEAVAAVRVEMKFAAGIATGDKYPAAIRGMAASVLSGEKSRDALDGAVVAFDALTESKKSTEAVAASAALPTTPAQTTDKLSEDHVCRSEADFRAAVARARGEVVK
jgi:ClpP class serine protease